jgi:hypothetical protein
VKRFVAVILYAVPLLYISSILAVSIHEMIGHGLTTRLLGGIFQGATVKLDAMGWADVDPQGFSPAALVTMYAGGAVSTGILTILLFSLGLLKRFGPLVRLTFFLIAFGFLQDGWPYYFWDSIIVGGIGDFSMIRNFYPSATLRFAVTVLSGAGLVSGIVLYNSVGYRLAGSLLGAGFPQDRRRKIIFFSVWLVLQALLWFAFDWNQIVPGVGIFPSVTAIAIAAVTMLIVETRGLHKIPAQAEKNSGQLKVPLIIAWICCLGTFLTVALWLQNGILF